MCDPCMIGNIAMLVLQQTFLAVMPISMRPSDHAPPLKSFFGKAGPGSSSTGSSSPLIIPSPFLWPWQPRPEGYQRKFSMLSTCLSEAKADCHSDKNCHSETFAKHRRVPFKCIKVALRPEGAGCSEDRTLTRHNRLLPSAPFGWSHVASA